MAAGTARQAAAGLVARLCPGTPGEQAPEPPWSLFRAALMLETHLARPVVWVAHVDGMSRCPYSEVPMDVDIGMSLSGHRVSRLSMRVLAFAAPLAIRSVTKPVNQH